MSKIIKTSNFSKDDYGPIGTGSKTSYDVILNTNSLGYFEIDELGPCMNPDGYVSNEGCPEKDPLCNCPKDLKPGGKEPTKEELRDLKYKTNECNLIKKNLSVKWFGIDYSNPSCSYNCVDKLSGVSGSTSGFTGISKGISTENVYTIDAPVRKSYGLTGASSGGTASFPFDGLSGASGASGSTEENGTKISYFSKYLEYSKTNATFWNTPKETPLYRKAQTALLTYQRIKITVNGNFDIKPGNLVNVRMPTPEMKNISETRFAGRWMVYKNEHVITTQKHSMILYLMRDGNYHDPDYQYSINTNKQG
jgi:hypothetical protein